MKILMLILVLGTTTFASESNQKKIEVCQKVSAIEDVTICDFGNLFAIHFAGQPATMISKQAPAPTPSPTHEKKSKK